MEQPGHGCNTTDFAFTMHEDRSVLHVTATDCRQHLQNFKAAAYAQQLQRLTQLYRLDLERATSQMKKKVIEIDRALVSNSQETILDDPEKFQAFIWSFGKEMHVGVHRWN